MALNNKITGLIIGELGTKRTQDVADSISSIRIDFTSSGASQLSFSVSDPDLKMHDHGYFVIRRQVRYLKTDWEMAAINVNYGETPSVDITCRREAVQKMKRDKGAANFGTISPTTFAAQQAKKFGLEFFGEASSGKEAIVRVQNERTDDSTWDVLKRLANDLEFEFFEADGILYFSSRKFLLEKQPSVEFWIPANNEKPFPVHRANIRRSDDDPLGASLTADVDRTNGVKLRPGMGIEVRGVAFYENKFMIDKVEWDPAGKEPVKVTAATLEDTPDVGCETQTIKKGATGACVKRIQQALAVTETSKFDAATESAVKKFQTKWGLTSDGIVGPQTWAFLRSKT